MPRDPSERRFPYGASPLLLAFILVFVGAGLAATGHAAWTGAPIGKLQGPAVSLAALVMAGVFAAVTALLVRSRQLGKREVVVASGWIELPLGPFSGRTLRITREGFRSVSAWRSRTTRFLTIVGKDGKVSVSDALVSTEAYDALAAWAAAARKA